MEFFPNMRTVLSIGNVTITWYALIILTGAFVAYYLTLRQTRKWGYKDEVFENFFLWLLPIAFLGARIYYVIFEWELYVNHPISALYIWEGGLAIHGGIIAGVIFGYFYFRHYKINGLHIADAIFPNLMIAQAIGRWGNFMNQEAYGQVVDASFYEGWPNFIKEGMLINGAYRQPTFLFESVGNIIGFCLIQFVYRKHGRRKRGDLAFAYLAWYGMVRFFVEGMRTDSLMLGPIRVAQLISLLGVLLGVLGILGVFDRLFKKVWPFRKEKPAVIFDLDGTLVDTKALIYASFQHTFKKYKPEYVLSDEELASFLGPTLKTTFQRYFDEDQIDEIIAYYRSYNHEHHDQLVQEFPNVKKTLTYLKEEGYPMAVMSNKLGDTVKMGLKRFGYDQYFDVVLGSEEIEAPKPSPSGILKACELLHVGHDDVIYIGDAITDIEACKRMGAFSVAFVPEEEKAEKMRKTNPCVMIKDMKELVDIVKEEQEWNDVTIY